ncbi:SemiSWEET transporter [Haliovirga abyssi]|uniref:Sugar transporter SemiSWEET n=1 Tax=Haliovirga abyssi TaxID=2996794 RepID=A0AAU9DGA9_9FUSO|nr:SemiSWEET transporter [Haliovirga abyssi]BDU51512.1 sugar transporter SemiSWEET [Haliovirga abyssi]
MTIVTVLGFTAATLTSLSFFPQAIKVIKTRDTKSISLIMYSMFTLGVFLWLLYGFFSNSMPVLIANIVTLIPATVVLILKIKEGNKN